jgi:Domain of unknown function DUF1828
MGGYVRIRTPFLYPDGDVIDLFVTEQKGTMTITDLGETMRWLRSQSLAPRRSPRQQKLVEDICLTHGLELFRGMLVARVKDQREFASVAIRAAQAALRVADIWFTMRTRSVESVSEEVAVFLAEKDISFDRDESLVGRSGRIWRPDFHTRTASKKLTCLRAKYW